MTKINTNNEFLLTSLDSNSGLAAKKTVNAPFQKDSISSAEDSDPYAFDVRAAFAASGPRMHPTDTGCTQTDSGCYGTQNGCHGTQSGCYGTQSGC